MVPGDTAEFGDAAALRAEAIRVLQNNDRGGYTIPTETLYPFQWNWDSAFCAMGIATYDVDRAWSELEHLYLGQWSSGLLPHIVFHRAEDSYYPGPEVWGASHQPPTSGISQPPLTATATRRILNHAAVTERGERDAKDRAAALYPKILAFHDWWERERDPDLTGVVAVLHPWETGADNSPVWDGPLRATPPTQSELRRRDVALVDATMRPRQWEYERYIYLVELYRSLGWDGARMWQATPFKVADVGLNAILMRDERDLLALAESFGSTADRERLVARAARRRAGFERLWHSEDGAYYSRDLNADSPIRIASHAGFLPLWGGIDDKMRVARLAESLNRWLSLSHYGAPTMAPDDVEFDQKRYWRGPVWAIINWMLSEGAATQGLDELANRLRGDTCQLMQQSGFCEYYDPLTGEGLGGGVFSWTAAAALAWALP